MSKRVPVPTLDPGPLVWGTATSGKRADQKLPECFGDSPYAGPASKGVRDSLPEREEMASVQRPRSSLAARAQSGSRDPRTSPTTAFASSDIRTSNRDESESAIKQDDQNSVTGKA